jgi:hypothetical protein
VIDPSLPRKHLTDDDYRVEQLLINNEENIANSLSKEEANSAHRLMFVMCRGRLRSVDQFREELDVLPSSEDDSSSLVVMQDWFNVIDA